ncbi:duf636 domain protein, partial [Moniliophthora roreri]
MIPVWGATDLKATNEITVIEEVYDKCELCVRSFGNPFCNRTTKIPKSTFKITSRTTKEQTRQRGVVRIPENQKGRGAVSGMTETVCTSITLGMNTTIQKRGDDTKAMKDQTQSIHPIPIDKMTRKLFFGFPPASSCIRREQVWERYFEVGKAAEALGAAFGVEN